MKKYRWKNSNISTHYWFWLPIHTVGWALSMTAGAAAPPSAPGADATASYAAIASRMCGGSAERPTRRGGVAASSVKLATSEVDL